jgi:hypothetical protein
MDIYWNIFTMHGPMNVKYPNNTSKWQMEFNSAFKGLIWFTLKILQLTSKISPLMSEFFFHAHVFQSNSLAHIEALYITILYNLNITKFGY